MHQGPRYTCAVLGLLWLWREKFNQGRFQRKEIKSRKIWLTNGSRREGLKVCLMFSLCCLTLISKTERKPVMRQRLVCILKEEFQPRGFIGHTGYSLMSRKYCSILMIMSQKEVQLNKVNLSFIFCWVQEVKERKTSWNFFEHCKSLHMKQTSWQVAETYIINIS